MTTIICVDDRDGVMFNHRRVSRDEVVLSQIIQIAEQSGNPLILSPYSAQLLEQADPNHPPITISEHPLLEAALTDVCFIEDTVADLNACPDGGLARIIIFHWGRKYPADEHFDRAAVLKGWHLKVREEFPGKSHETITKEIYEK